MKQRSLGKNGPQVSAIGLGCMSIAGAYGPADEGESLALLDAAYAAGVNFYDTANIYGMGKSETILGKWIASRQPQIVLATKAAIIPGPQRQVSNDPAYLRAELEASLTRLGVDHVDLFYIHRRDSGVAVEEVAGAMSRLIEEGKIGGYGLSECAPATLRRAHAVHPCRAVQSEYSLWTRQPELGMIRACQDLGVAFVPFSPVGRGMLVDQPQSPDSYARGDFRRANPRFSAENFDRNTQKLQGFRDLAAAKGVSTATLAMAWVLHQGAKDLIAIPGTRSTGHLQQLLAATDLTLSAADLADIDRLLPPGFAEGDRYAEAQHIGVENYC